MPQNDFKAFATGENANVLTQDEYNELEAVTGGFTAGIAKSEELNKVWRQASTIAAVVASFMASETGKDVLDNGDLDTLRQTLSEALLNNATGTLDSRYLQCAGNLSDVSDKQAARENIGCGNAATMSYSTADYKQLAGAETEAASTKQLVGLRDETVKKTGGDIDYLNVKGNLRVDGPDFIVKNGVVYDKDNNANNTMALRAQGSGNQFADLYFWEQIGQWAALRLHVFSGNSDGDFQFSNYGDFRANRNIVAGGELQASNGAVRVAQDGNINGTMWGGWLRDWLNWQLTARDNNINTRATWDYVNQLISEVQNWTSQNFVSGMDLTAPVEVRFTGGVGYPRGTDGAHIYNLAMVGGDSNVGVLLFRYQRYYKNGWIVLN